MSNQLNRQSPLIRLSQGQLNLLETCPPKFQQVYLEQLTSPLSPGQQAKIDWGSQFHLLMQQRELDLPIDSLLQEEQELNHSLQALVKAVSEIWDTQPESWRDAEHYCALNFQGYLLTAVYDLLITTPTQAQIFDWKTYLQPEDEANLAKDWQTRLYLYLLAETSAYFPEQISMTYWFVKLPQEPQNLTFKYSSKQHKQTRQDLIELLTQLDEYLAAYMNENISFAHKINCRDFCPYYPVVLNAQKLSNVMLKREHQDWRKTIASIEELSI